MVVFVLIVLAVIILVLVLVPVLVLILVLVLVLVLNHPSSLSVSAAILAQAPDARRVKLGLQVFVTSVDKGYKSKNTIPPKGHVDPHLSTSCCSKNLSYFDW